MTHAEASEQLSAYLDGELTDAERAELEAQLARDPALRSELEQIESTIAFLRTHGPVQAPPDFRDKVLAAVKDEPMPGGWWRWLRRPFGLPIEGLAVALAAALVLIVALPLGLHKPAAQVKDLAGEGFMSREEARSSYSAPQQQAPAAQEQAPAAQEQAQGQAPPPAGQEAAEPQAQAVPKDRWQKPRTAPNAPAIATTEPKATTRTSAPTDNSNGEAAPTAGLAETTSKTAPVQAPPPAPGAIYAYKILTRDPGALTGLQRIAARYKGRVLDSQGHPATGPLKVGETYVVEIPSGALAPFGDDLRSLGMVSETPEPSGYAGGIVKVQVAFDLVPDDSSPVKASDVRQ